MRHQVTPNNEPSGRQLHLSDVRPQDVVLRSSFMDILAWLTRSRLTLEDGVPLIQGNSLFYSTDHYPGPRRQYFIGDIGLPCRKFYNVKPPLTNLDNLWGLYTPSFRRNVRKSLSCNLSSEWHESGQLSRAARSELYEIHCEATARIRTFAFPQRHFDALFDIVGVPISVLVVRNQRAQIVSFQLMIGTLAYISGLRKAGLAAKAGNFLVHEVYRRHLTEILYLGTGFIGSGIDRFKRSSGAVQIPCHPIPEPLVYKAAYFASRVGISRNRLVQLLVKFQLRTTKGILSYMPYA